MKMLHPYTGEEVEFRYTDECLAELQQVHRPCPHEIAELRVYTIADGRRQVWKQCLACGSKVGNAVKVEDKSTIAPADSALLDAHVADMKAAREAVLVKHLDLQLADNDRFWAEYDEYLRGDKWRLIRSKVMRRSGGRCEGCGDANATQVHHLNYDHVFDEFLFELVALCDACHTKCHQ